MEGAIEMPNYRYQTQDYQRRQACGCQNQNRAMQHTAAQRAAVQRSAEQQSCMRQKENQQRLSDMPIAMAYVPWQEWYGIFDLEKGFRCGTIFEELNKPFHGAGGRC